MSTPLIIIGAGGFGRETLDVVEAINAAQPHPVFDVLGVVDSNPSQTNRERLRQRGIVFLGSESEWLSMHQSAHAEYLIGVGCPTTRGSIQSRFHKAGFRAAQAIHPSAVVGTQVQIGHGTVICGGSQVSTNVTIGCHVHVNPHSTIGHDCTLDDFVSLNPGAVISGDVRIQTGSLVGAGAVILPGLDIGANSTIGAAACVVKNVTEGSTVKGVPAR